MSFNSEDSINLTMIEWAMNWVVGGLIVICGILAYIGVIVTGIFLRMGD